MSDTENLAGQIILWGVRLAGLFIFYLVFKNLKPNIFYKGWGQLRSEYSVADDALPAGVKLEPAWVRVGSETYSGTIAVGLDDTAVYLQREYFFKVRGTLRIPYSRLQLVEAPHRTKLLNIPVHGVFRVGGVDLWIGAPYADGIITHLSIAPL